MLPSIVSFPILLMIYLALLNACTAEKLPPKKIVTKPLVTKTTVIRPHQPTVKSSEKWIAPLSIWLLIDTDKKRLEVKRGERVLTTFNHIAIGRRGAGFKKKRGDKITPQGVYRIGWINYQSSFRTFYGFTYPSVKNAQNALKKRLISSHEYDAIMTAHENNRVPPQNTALGGRIGLHGLGRSNAKIHQMWNWTKGCVAVTNQQIDELDEWIVIGMTVKIK